MTLGNINGRGNNNFLNMIDRKQFPGTHNAVETGHCTVEIDRHGYGYAVFNTIPEENENPISQPAQNESDPNELSDLLSAVSQPEYNESMGTLIGTISMPTVLNTDVVTDFFLSFKGISNGLKVIQISGEGSKKHRFHVTGKISTHLSIESLEQSLKEIAASNIFSHQKKRPYDFSVKELHGNSSEKRPFNDFALICNFS